MLLLYLAIGLTTAGAVALGAYGLYVQRAGSRAVLTSRLASGAPAARLSGGSILRARSKGLPLVARLPVSAEGRERLQQQLDRGGLRWKVQEFLALRLALAVGLSLVAVLVLLALGLPLYFPILGGIAALILGWTLPRQYLARRIRKRMVEIEVLLPDALTRISKSLRAGSGLLQSLAYAAEETPAPLGPEFASTLRDLQLGADPVGAFEALSARVGQPDLEIAVTAIIIQRTVGGNLSEILGNVANTIRGRAAVQREVRVLVARQTLQANMTAALPIATAALFILITPEIGGALINTRVGNVALAFAVLCEAIGIWVIRRMAIIKV